MMTLTDERIKEDIKLLQSAFKYIIENVGKGLGTTGEFQIIDPTLVPYGLPTHTRSISWLVEAILLQTAKQLDEKSDPNYKKITQFDEIQSWPSDIDIIDYLILLVGSEKIYVNVKLHDINSKDNSNDLNQGARIFSHFDIDPDFRFYYIIVNFEFTGVGNTKVRFAKGEPTVIYVPQVEDVKVNKKNGHLQTRYTTAAVSRTMKEFLDELKKAIIASENEKQLKKAEKRIADTTTTGESHMLWLNKQKLEKLKKTESERIANGESPIFL